MRIRVALRSDLAAVQRLLPMAEPTLGEEATMMLEHPKHAAGLVRALRDGRSALFPRSADRMSPYDVLMEISVVLVAVDERSTVIGALMALPPVRILGQALQAGVPMPQILAGALTVMKIKGVAVAETARGRGVGRVLIEQFVQLYTALGWQLLYGQIDKHSTLDSYYTRLGFTVLASRESINLGPVLGFPLSVVPMPGERLFVHWSDTEQAERAQ
jgi:GNAT superfamily N-acetyltransferase